MSDPLERAIERGTQRRLLSENANLRTLLAQAEADKLHLATHLREANLDCQGLRTLLAQAEAEAEAMREGRDRLKNSLDARLNDWLCEMKPDYDDSIVGFNEAWDIMRKTFADFKAHAALQAHRPHGEESK